MAKIADKYFLGDSFTIREEGYDPLHGLESESIFSLANEYMGLRGMAEEGTVDQTLFGTYINGVYELYGEEGPGGYKGIVKQTHYMVCCGDYLYTRIFVGEEQLILGKSQVTDFTRELDMKTGILTRQMTWHTTQGELTLTFLRQLSMVHKERAGQKIIFKAQQPMNVTISLGVDGTKVHANQGVCNWHELSHTADQNKAAISFKTATTNQVVTYAYQVKAPVTAAPHKEHGMVYHTYDVALQEGVEAVFEKEIGVFRDKTSEEATALLTPYSFNDLTKDNQSHYEIFWNCCDVEIGGDIDNQQGIRYCLFQLHQTFRGAVDGANIGAKGLTGEAYNGHAFWDTETYCLPFYLLNDMNAAKQLLLFRYRTLPQAKERAIQLDLKGACYPIATLNGKEACNLWQHASLQLQPSTAVAYGIWDYVHLTKDMDFLYGAGGEMLVEISRYLCSRGDWNQDKSGYGYYGVMGPDEFHMMVNNNFYTNYMGKKTLAYALNMINTHPDKAAFMEKMNLTQEEIEVFAACEDKMILAQREDLVYPQHEGYFSLPHLDVKSIPISEFPLYSHWSYDRIYRTDMIKQPDVLMAMFLYPNDFSLAEKQANYDYYEPRCIHESSLSPSIHSILAMELGRQEEAFRFFGFATRLDLDNYNRNTGEGLHLTSIAAAWVTIVYGFGGLRTDGQTPSLMPQVPPKWDHLSFRITIHGSVLLVEATKNDTMVKVLSGDPIELKVYEKIVTVTDKGITVTK